MTSIKTVCPVFKAVGFHLPFLKKIVAEASIKPFVSSLHPQVDSGLACGRHLSQTSLRSKL